jgi:hypothetical protein
MLMLQPVGRGKKIFSYNSWLPNQELLLHVSNKIELKPEC